jgi:hypothetical protein
MIKIMPGADFIPKRNHPFSNWEKNFVDEVNQLKSGWTFDTDTEDEWKLLTITPKKKRKPWIAAKAKEIGKNFNPSEETELLAARRDYEETVHEWYYVCKKNERREK